MNRNTRNGFLVLIAIGLVAPFFAYPIFVMKVLCLALFACAFNLLLGYTGLISFGHAAYFGSSAYIAGHAAKVWGLTPELAILTGTAWAALLGYLFGSLAIRRQGIYFAMITLGLAQVIYFLASQMKFTGGEDGLQSVPRGNLFGLVSLNDNLVMYYFVFAVFMAAFWLIHRIVDSPFGHILQSIRENENRTISLGYDVDRYKLMAFVLSAALSGLAGSIKVLVFQFASLTDVYWHTNGMVMLVTLLGGVGTLFGPVVGAVLVSALEHYFSSYGSWVTIITGSIFVVCVMIFRRGMVGELLALLKR